MNTKLLKYILLFLFSSISFDGHAIAVKKTRSAALVYEMVVTYGERDINLGVVYQREKLAYCSRFRAGNARACAAYTAANRYRSQFYSHALSISKTKACDAISEYLKDEAVNEYELKLISYGKSWKTIRGRMAHPSTQLICHTDCSSQLINNGHSAGEKNRRCVVSAQETDRYLETRGKVIVRKLRHVSQPRASIVLMAPYDLASALAGRPLDPLMTDKEIIDELSQVFGKEIIGTSYYDGEVDLYVVEYHKHKIGYIQNHALPLVNFLTQLSDSERGEIPTTVIGLSFGGVVTRYALSYMHHLDRPHNVQNFVSIDAPHRGVSIPLSLQTVLVDTHKNLVSMKRYFNWLAGRITPIPVRRARRKIQSIINKMQTILLAIHSPISRQFLISHVDGENGNSHALQQQLLDEIEVMGDDDSINKIAITFGNLTGNRDTRYTVCPLSMGRCVLRNDEFSRELFNVNYFNYPVTFQVAANMLAAGQKYSKTLLRVSKGFVNRTYVEERIASKNSNDYTFVRGSTKNFFLDIKEYLKKIGFEIEIDESIPNQTFVPTVSSLDMPNCRYDEVVPISCQSSFDKVLGLDPLQLDLEHAASFYLLGEHNLGLGDLIKLNIKKSSSSLLQALNDSKQNYLPYVPNQ